ncbi:unnamed protein product [Chilo suppressalis]|uniref:Juvenile hormone binding protein n=1 Tax=Chilo suppressalis TaxID=168631 RepID=A0ABN8AZJ2_CHISP|nr:unnamed protein product [Chilo suppressalis]
MGLNIIFLVSVFINCVFSKEGITESCDHNDIECLKTQTINVFAKASAGAPDYNMEPTDPFEIKKMEYTDPATDIVMQFENMKITGFKNQKMVDFKLNTDTKAVEYRGRVEVDIAADVSVKINEDTEILSGTYKAKATSIGIVRYFYSLNVGSDGVEHYTIGPETITCEPVGVPEVTLDLQHSNIVEKDPGAVSRKADYLKRAEEIKRKPVCTIITKGYKHVFVQLRALANALPKSAILKDI